MKILNKEELKAIHGGAVTIDLVALFSALAPAGLDEDEALVVADWVANADGELNDPIILPKLNIFVLSTTEGDLLVHIPFFGIVINHT